MNRTRESIPERDERELQFDVRRLDSGDTVEVYVESERRWVRGEFTISTSGLALVQLTNKSPMRFEEALAMGIKRILH